jgi:sigma-B regulation protein RsbU (phosphoserine phosphatase)
MPDTVTPEAMTPNLTVVDKLRMLLDITRKISRSLDLNEVLNLVMDTLDSLIPYHAAGIYIIHCKEPAAGNNEKQPCDFRAEALRGYDLDELTNLRLRLGEGLIGSVAQSGHSILVPDVSQDPRYLNARPETKSEMVAPIISNDKVVGVFDIESDNFNAYDQDDLEVLKLLAAQVAIIIEKVELHEHLVEKKRLEGQLEVARQVQLELLPHADPQLKGFDISAYNFSTEEVSGDYYDWLNVYQDQLGVVIADVSGKGVPAALLMAFLRASLRAALHIGYAPHVALSKVNSLLCESIEGNQFVTAIYGVLDTTTHTLAYANAGHNPPLLLDEKGYARYVSHGGLPLGMFDNTAYHEHFLKIEPGAILVLYTDGVTEAANGEEVEFGRERLSAATREFSHLPAREMIQAIHRRVIEWTDGRGADDDVTFFIIKAL